MANPTAPVELQWGDQIKKRRKVAVEPDCREPLGTVHLQGEHPGSLCQHYLHTGNPYLKATIDEFMAAGDRCQLCENWHFARARAAEKAVERAAAEEARNAVRNAKAQQWLARAERREKEAAKKAARIAKRQSLSL